MTRRAPETSIRIPRRVVTVTALVVGAVVAIAVFFGLSALIRANEPQLTASTSQLASQQLAVERDIERAYEQAAEQIAKVRALNLAITPAQADQIAAKSLTDLKTLRHNAFVTVGQVLGFTPAESENYAVVTEQKFDKAPVRTVPSPTPVLLAPRFYTIVSRMSELATRIADQTTNALTAPAPATPSPSPRVSPSPSPSR